MGFCLFNNAAVAARAAQAEHGLERVAILDWDVHHGNGTQDDLLGRPDRPLRLAAPVAVLPGHRRAGRGERDDGERPAAGGIGRRGVRPRRSRRSSSRPCVGFEPDLLIVSAGFDAHADDPLAWMEVTGPGFRELARRCRGLAPRVAAVLEGGYNLETLPGLVHAALDGFS